jgi:hypothetical protein
VSLSRNKRATNCDSVHGCDVSLFLNKILNAYKWSKNKTKQKIKPKNFPQRKNCGPEDHIGKIYHTLKNNYTSPSQTSKNRR